MVAVKSVVESENNNQLQKFKSFSIDDSKRYHKAFDHPEDNIDLDHFYVCETCIDSDEDNMSEWCIDHL